MEERVANYNTLVAVLESKLDQLIQKVDSIVELQNNTKEEIAELKLKIRDLENENKQQQKEIDEQKQASKTNKNWLMGIGSGLIVAVVGALLRTLMGV